MFKKEELEKIKSSIICFFEKLNKYHLSPIWVIPTIAIVFGTIVRFCFYVVEVGKCTFWNITTNAIEIGDGNIFDFLYSISYIFMFIMYSYILYQLMKIVFINIKGRFLITIIAFLLFNVSLISVLFAFIIFMTNDIHNSIYIALILHVICALIDFNYLLYKKIYKPKKRKISFVDLIITVVLIPIMIVLLGRSGYKSQEEQKEFKLIDNYVVVYENNNKYYLVEYDKNNNIINTKKQRIISNNNVEYQIIEISDYKKK